MSTLHDRLAELADSAERTPGAPAAALWERGVRRARLRRAASVAAVAAVVAVVAGGLTVRTEPPAPLPADVPFEQLHLPEHVRPPGTWSDAGRPTGPLAALGLDLRTRPEGLFGERQGLEVFGVSAVDGRAGWIDLPGVSVDARALVGWYALSPDGRWIGWTRHEGPERPDGSGPQVGWSVLDTTTGEVRDLADPAARRVADATDLAFSGDSRYLLTSYEKRGGGGAGDRSHRFVAVDVRTGERTTVEGPGEKWVPSFGSAPTGIAWSRGRTVHRLDPRTGERRELALPQSVVVASWGPDDRAFAYIGRPPGAGGGPWRLYAGRSVAEARDRPLPLDIEPGEILGWRDDRHVVVGRFRTTATIVDVVTGETETLDLAGGAEKYAAPLLAADLWHNPLVAPVDQPGGSDPRRPYLVGAGVAGFGAVIGILWSLRRRRGRA
ncbi:hypothetical protein [Nocardioides marmotae]|uniref:hypothetical protein n=1 Tax=Nocardioides marmotae TaxID=2663857 RepID=UPI0012B5693C|nr:hypothetical protein [Nocardioides marmotae]MBC9731920.1 hypothetical protein [Nocardioides marmotae]MTB83040.1 hypothetical protein [Nocardioides marmotae]